MQDILNKLGINEEHTKGVKQPKEFTKLTDNMYMKEDHTHMADLLMLPETSKGYKYLLVVTDIVTREFDIEPLKSKESNEVLAAMKRMYKRPYLKKPSGFVKTDQGSEFKHVFHKWLYNQGIIHSQAQPNRHSQMSMVESLNKQLGRLFNGYMNKIETETGKEFKDWDKIISTVRIELNKHRKKAIPKNHVYKTPDITPDDKPKFKVGDVVYRLLDAPKNALGHNQSTKQFRVGDFRYDVKNPRKITNILEYNGKIKFRYTLEGLDSVSFTESQLKLAKNEKASKYTVEKIIDVRTRNKKKEYLVKWKGYTTDKSTWEPASNLIEDGFGPEIKAFNKK